MQPAALVLPAMVRKMTQLRSASIRLYISAATARSRAEKDIFFIELTMSTASILVMSMCSTLDFRKSCFFLLIFFAMKNTFPLR